MGKYDDLLREYRERQNGGQNQTAQPQQQNSTGDRYSNMLAEYRKRQEQEQQQSSLQPQQPTVYEQRKERQNQAAENAKKAWWDVLGLAAQDATSAAMGQPKMLTAEEVRQRANAGANLNAAIKENREANKIIDWDGRKELLKEYRRLDKIDNPQARQQAQEIREQLRQGDVKAGNLAEGGDMAYNFGDWTGRIVPGGVKNFAAGTYNALLTGLDMNAKAQAMQGPTEDELIQEWLTGQEPGSIQKQRQAGYESPEFRQFMNDRYAEASAIRASAQRDLQIAKENQRPVVKAGVDIGENIIEMGADVAIAHLTGGSSLIPMAVRVFGSGAMDAREQGYSLEQQAAYGAAQAAIEIFTEKIGGIGGRGKGWSDALADKLVDELAQTTMGKNALRFLIGVVEEGGEEVLSDFLQPLANYSAGMEWDGYNLEEMLYDFLIGGAVGGMSSVKSMTLGSGNAAPQTAQEAAGAPQMARGAEIAPTGAEAPTAAPVELNSQERAAEAAAPAEAATKTLADTALQTPTESATAKPGRSEEARNATQRAAYEGERNRLAQQSEERQQYLQQKRGEHADFLNGLHKGDRVYLDGSSTPAMEVVNSSADGMTILFYDADGEVFSVERVLPESFTGDGVISALETSERVDVRPSGAAPTAPSQQNIDNTAPAAYTKTEGNGGITNEQGRSNAEAGRRVSDGQSGLAERNSSRGGSGGSPGVLQGELLSQQNADKIRARVNPATKRGGVVVEFHDGSTDTAAFCSALDAAKAADEKYGWMVDAKTPEGLAKDGAKVYINDEGNAGFAVNADGDIVAVFRNKNGGPKGATESMIPQALAAGGTKLDCFGTNLVSIYAQHGFIPVARVRFDAEFAKENIPGWTPDKGEPPIYFMMHNGDSVDTVVDKYGKYPQITQEQLDSLPWMDYDDAYAYRDELLAKQNGDGGGNGQDPSARPGGLAQDDSGETGLVPVGESLPEEQSGPSQSIRGSSPQPVESKVTEPGEASPEPGQKRSKTESNTLQHMAERLGGEQDELYYTPKSERESLSNAINRVDADMGGEMQKLLDKEMWNGEDIDTALTIQGMLQLDGVQTGDFSAAQAWARAIQARGTESGRALQAFSKWTRSGAAAAAQSVETLLEAENLTEEDRTRISNDVYQFGRDYDSIEDGDLDGIRDLIRRQARYRNTWTFGKKGFERMLNEVTDFEWLKEYAMRQMMNIPGDYTHKADLGQKVKTWQVLAQLSRLGTFFRNIGGNGVFGIQDTLSQDFFGVALDAMLGKLTGKRTIGLDKGWLSSAARKGARQGLVRSILEVAGDVDMGGGGNRYDQATNRTFKMTGGALSRLMSRWEQALGYSLTSSDRTFRGGIEAEQQRGLSGFENLTEEERQALAQNMADYRLFQNHGVAYGVSKGLHDIANLIGFGGQRGQLGRQGGFGVADLANPYPGVPANLGVKALEYSPLNVAKGLTEMAKLLSDAKTGGKIDVKQQQNAVMDVARGLHGTALLAGLAALFKAGLFKNADDEEDKDAKALANAEGRQGVQMNLSGMLRYLQGGSAEWKDGDELLKIDWLEPMNAFLAIASMAADENDFPGYVGATFDGTLQSILDMPVMESISNIFDNYNYSKGETVREKLGDVAVGFGADALTGMLPAPVSQTARAMDPYYRETIGENAADTALRRVMNAIPGLRQRLDPKLDNFGRPKEQASSAYNRWMNSFVRPGQISDYKLDDVDRALDEFAQRTGEAVYPDRKAPNSFSAGGQKIQLSGEEKQAYQETYGQAALQYYGEILLGDEYKDASDGEKQWLLDQAEAYAAYQAKKAILEQRGETYSNSSWDKVDALEEKGGNPFGYLFAKQGLKTATDGKDYKAVDALLGDIDKMDKATQEQLFADVNRLDDRVEAHKAGIDTVLWEAAYAQKKKLEEDKSTTAVQDTISFAQWADSQKDLNRKQKDLLRDQMGFYTTFRADAEKFDQLTGAGLSADKAGKVWNAINALQPLEGHAGVTQNQRLKAISSMGNLSDAEKWAVLELYASESAYKKAMDAKAKGWTFDQWVQSYTKGK